MRYMAPPIGLEPITYRLTAGCSAIELQGNKSRGDYTREGSLDARDVSHYDEAQLHLGAVAPQYFIDVLRFFRHG